jgi:hypothetical protein
MGWKNWLGLSTSREQFARKLIQEMSHRGAPGWSYDAGEGALVYAPDNRRFFLHNAWLEYSSAPGASRAALLEKYVSVLVVSGHEIQKLWEVAATRLCACVRSRYHLVSLDINSRGSSTSVPRPLSKHWHRDLDIVLMYDFGPSLSGVTADAAEPWGQTLDAIFERAQANMAALERPSWKPLGNGVFQLLSDVSFEESFVLVADIWTSLDVQGAPVVALPNRGVLLATGTDNPAGLSRLLAEARRSMQERPWPLSATLLQRAGGGWHVFQPPEQVASAARTFDLISRSITYAEQKEALEKYLERENLDIYVGKFDLMRSTSDPQRIESWCTWAEGIESLLPETDVVILGRGEESNLRGLIVRWPDVVRICGGYMQPTEDDPPRFRVNVFPIKEWPQLEATGQQMKRR